MFFKYDENIEVQLETFVSSSEVFDNPFATTQENLNQINNQSITANAQNITTNVQNITTNVQNITANAQDITANVQNTTTNAQDIDTLESVVESAANDISTYVGAGTPMNVSAVASTIAPLVSQAFDDDSNVGYLSGV
jgi:methyl-accepting chemotaxis protein